METKNFIGQNFWKFFNVLPMWRRKKELLEKNGDEATLLITNEESNEQYKVVCKCQSHSIMTYCFCTGSYLDFEEIISITKL